MPSSNIDVVKAVYDAFASGDAGAIFAGFAAELDWRQADGFLYSERNPYRSPDDVAEGVLGRILAEWEGFEVVPERYTADADTVVALGRYRGTYRATGKSIDVPMAEAWTLRDGQIVGFRQYVDTYLVRQAIS